MHKQMPFGPVPMPSKPAEILLHTSANFGCYICLCIAVLLSLEIDLVTSWHCRNAKTYMPQLNNNNNKKNPFITLNHTDNLLSIYLFWFSILCSNGQNAAQSYNSHWEGKPPQHYQEYSANVAPFRRKHRQAHSTL